MEDLRIVKTKKNLYDSLIKLMSVKEFEDIKVSDICSLALINRSTFYSHFNDKYELLYSFISDLKNDLQEHINKNEKIDSLKEYYLSMISLFLDHIDENIDIYSMIVKNNSNSIVMDMINNTLFEDVNKNIKLVKKSDIPTDFVSDFYMGAILNIGINYLKNPKKYKKEKVVTYLDKLLPDDI